MSRPVPSLRYAARREVIERMAPSYREASFAQKGLLLDTVVATTGYARKYAIRLLNQAEEGTRTIHRRRLPRYGQEVQQALFVAWKATRYICAKRLIPFLPTLVPALEHHGHLHLTEESRTQLLSVSHATAERLLHSQRKPSPRGLGTTQAGPLLKDQIPIRTFQQWDEARPGFLEADLVGHHGGNTQGCFLYTLTLTDIATGWTECLPLLYKSPEAVLSALRQARALFPFPILGLDVDNGGEFINEPLARYCEAEQITFTRGREKLKADQCFVEQKNGAIVRQFVGRDRLVGEQAYRQLRELYRAVRLYVNCFQPSTKLVSKDCEGEKVRRVYDPAKTPWQRLLLCGSLPADQQHHLSTVVQALDPLALLQQVEQLQQAVWRYAATLVSPLAGEVEVCIQPFCVERSLPEAFEAKETGAVSTEGRHWAQQHAQQGGKGLLDWPRTSRDPFEGQWELILSLVLTHPEWSGSDLFCKMQRRFPGRYRPSQQRTLQMGLRKIRARLLALLEEPWPPEVIHGPVSRAESDRREQEEGKRETLHAPLVSLPTRFPLGQAEQTAGPLLPEPTGEQGISRRASSTSMAHLSPEEPPTAEPDQVIPPPEVPLSLPRDQKDAQLPQPRALTIEGAIQRYLQQQREAGRSPKTLEWHQTALSLLQRYLRDERHLCLPCQITQSEVRGWLAHLGTTPSITTTTERSASTIHTYARSARAFCHWLVRNGHLERPPLVRGTMPKPGKKAIHLIEPDEFEHLLLACRAGGESDESVERATVRNRAILWVLLDTGIRVSELCALRLWDVDREHRAIRVQSTGGNERSLPLSSNGWYQLLSYLEQSRPQGVDSQRGGGEQDHLFLSEWSQPLSINAITLLFGRIKQRAGISDKPVSPSVLRDTFAARYLQAGGTLEVLGDLLGLRDLAALKRYARLSTHKSEHEPQKAPAEVQPSRPRPVRQTGRRRRRRASSTGSRDHQQPEGGRPNGSLGNKPIREAGDDP